MPTLHATRLIECWERGLTGSLPTRALLLLACARPHETRAALHATSVGEADACLLALHERLFGRAMRGYGDCRECGERFALTVDAQAIRVSHDRRSATHVLAEGAYTVSYRSLTYADLAKLTPDMDVAEAERVLLSCCVVEACGAGAPCEADALPDFVRETLSAQLEQHDAQAEVVLGVTCAGCGEEQPLLFDVVTHLWTQLERWARALLCEVHVLASAYGWSERSILRMSAGRRAAYLAQITSSDVGAWA
ncbi:MAG: hypothetical protein ABW252_03760 [Polyangiales bacterium]